MVRRFIPEWEMLEYIKSYRNITEQNFEKGIIDEEMYLEILHEIERQYQENKQALAIERLLAGNFM